MMRYGYGSAGGGFWLLIGPPAVDRAHRDRRVGGHALLAHRTGGHARPSRPTPNEILRERFARGEITAQQFEDAKKVLGPDR